MLLDRLKKDGVITPPSFLPSNTHYLVRMGSEAYGCATDSSDVDVYGWCIPPRGIVFPHLAGHILGFGKPPEKFECWQQHHVTDVKYQVEYDFSVYGVVHYFNLVMNNNPNMVDSLFVPDRCILHETQAAQIVRENRTAFLHKGCWHTFRGYSYQQLKKMSSKEPKEGSNRYELIKKHGYDTKFASHVIRLMLECQQILEEQTLDLERNSQLLLAVKRGEWAEQQVREFFSTKEKYTEELYQKSSLPYKPDQDRIKSILMRVLESHYGSLDNAVKEVDAEKKCLREVKSVMERYGF